MSRRHLRLLDRATRPAYDRRLIRRCVGLREIGETPEGVAIPDRSGAAIEVILKP